MGKTFAGKDFLSYITPDPAYPAGGFVRINNSKIKYIAQAEGVPLPDNVASQGIIGDEERLVVKIMINHDSTILIKKECETPKQVIVYFHRDGIVSCENESPEVKVFHCFETIDDLAAYHINAFICAEYEEPEYPYHFLVPTDSTLYREPHTISYAEKLKQAVLQKLKETDVNHPERLQIEKSYMDEWETPRYSLQLHANDRYGNVGFISFLFCRTCIWAVYPYKKDYARVKVMGSAEAQNKFVEFICSFTEGGGGK